MAFEGLSAKLQLIFKKLTGKGRLSEADVKEAMREVRLALLEADVNYLVVKQFINDVIERAVGSEVTTSLTPGQQVIKIVNEELCKLMGGANSKLEFGSTTPAVILLAGLQGAGKTTMSAKLAAYLKKQYAKSPLLAACDIYRPAAIRQLQIVGEAVGIPVFTYESKQPAEIAAKALEYAKKHFNDVVLLDTAGRLHIDNDMMQELSEIKTAVHPVETLLVVDAMTGQDAVNISKAFDEALGLTGIMLTKLDGDTRGGAALSVRAVTKKPIKFSGVGEKLQDIEPFHPDRMASRILGMGDMLSLIEKTQAAFDENKAHALAEKLRRDSFTLSDFLEQFRQMKSIGSFEEILGMMPGMDAKKLGNLQPDEKLLGRMEAIILSMTKAERTSPEILNASRKRRIAAGSGTSIQEINRLLNQFDASKKMIRQFAGGKPKKGSKRMQFPF